jgi:predicted nucleic acid-binding protein
VAFKWVVPEPDSDKAERIREDYRQGVHELIAPDVFPIEVGHALTRAERQRRIPVGGAGPQLLNVLSTSPVLHPSLTLLLRACTVSSQARIGIYDCLYVALAEQEGCQFITADARLIANLQPQFPFIVSLASFP